MTAHPIKVSTVTDINSKIYMPVIKAIFLKHVFHHFIFCLLLLLYRDSVTLLVEIQVDIFSSTQQRMNWFYLLKQIQKQYEEFGEKLICNTKCKSREYVENQILLALTIMAYRMKLRNDGMTKGIELRCRKQNHLSNISLWDQQNVINKKELFEKARKRK